MDASQRADIKARSVLLATGGLGTALILMLAMRALDFTVLAYAAFEGAVAGSVIVISVYARFVFERLRADVHEHPFRAGHNRVRLASPATAPSSSTSDRDSSAPTAPTTPQAPAPS